MSLFLTAINVNAKFVLSNRSHVEYDTKIPNLIIRIQGSSLRKKNKSIKRAFQTLTIEFTNLGEEVVSTSLLYNDEVDSPYLESMSPYGVTQEVYNGSSRHKVLVSNYRPAGSLDYILLQLHGANGSIIDTVPVRFSIESQTHYSLACAAVVVCLKYQYPNEDPIYHYAVSCNSDGGIYENDLYLCE